MMRTTMQWTLALIMSMPTWCGTALAREAEVLAPETVVAFLHEFERLAAERDFDLLGLTIVRWPESATWALFAAALCLLIITWRRWRF